MRDPLIDEARKAARLFDRPEVRLQASAMAKALPVSAGVPHAELELREAIRCLMMALPLAPTGTHGLIASALSPATRALSLAMRIRGMNVEVEADPPAAPQDTDVVLRLPGHLFPPRPDMSGVEDGGSGSAPAEQRLPYYIEKD